MSEIRCDSDYARSTSSASLGALALCRGCPATPTAVFQAGEARVGSATTTATITQGRVTTHAANAALVRAKTTQRATTTTGNLYLTHKGLGAVGAAGCYSTRRTSG
jgi:hypothetical protein